MAQRASFARQTACTVCVCIALLGARPLHAQWQRTAGPSCAAPGAVVAIDGNLYATFNNVYRTTNGGAHWTALPVPIVNDSSASTLTAPLICGIGNALFATAARDGLWRSTDAGNSWREFDATFRARDVAQLVEAAGVLFCSAFAYGDSGLASTPSMFISRDTGASWSPLAIDSISQIVAAFAVDDTIFISADTVIDNGWERSHVLISLDAGATWHANDSGMTATYVNGFVNTAQGLVAYTSQGLFARSGDGGGWRGIASVIDSSALTPTTVQSFAAAGNTWLVGTFAHGVMRSTDAGATWHAANDGLIASTMVTSLTHVDDLFIAGCGCGIFLSRDSGATWESMEGDVGLSAVGALAIEDNVLLAGTHGGGVYRSVDGGAHWTAGNAGLPSATVFAFAGIGPYTFAGTAAGVVRSTDDGATWTSSADHSGTGSLVICSANVYGADAGGRIYRSTDLGATWTISRAGGGDAVDANTLAADNAVVIAATKTQGAVRTTDDGTTWWPLTIDSATNVHQVFCTGDVFFAQTQDAWPLLYRSTNRGDTWEIDTAGIDYVPNALSIIAWNGAVLLGGESGCYFSTDRGVTWKPFANDVPGDALVDAFVATSETLFAGTEGAGVWSRPLDAVAVRAPPASPRDAALQLCPNPCRGAFTATYRLDAPDDVRLTLVDALGRTIASRTARESAGEHSAAFALPHGGGAYFFRVRSRTMNITRAVLQTP